MHVKKPRRPSGVIWCYYVSTASCSFLDGRCSSAPGYHRKTYFANVGDHNGAYCADHDAVESLAGEEDRVGNGDELDGHSNARDDENGDEDKFSANLVRNGS